MAKTPTTSISIDAEAEENLQTLANLLNMSRSAVISGILVGRINVDDYSLPNKSKERLVIKIQNGEIK